MFRLLFLFALALHQYNNGVYGLKLTEERILNTTENSYKYHPTPMSWHDAKKQCELEGASLFYPSDEQEVEEVLGTLAWETLWVGIHINKRRSGYVTIDGEKIRNHYDKWAPGQPRSFGIYECVTLFYDGDLIDNECETLYPFVCEVVTTPTTPDGNEKTTEKSAQDHDSQAQVPADRYLNTTMYSYKYHPTPMTWQDAKKQCELEGASLFVPGNEEEVQQVLGSLARETMWVGLHIDERRNNTSIRQYVTTDGLEIRQVYHKWHNGQPVIFGYKDCVMLFSYGVLVDKECERLYPFVCSVYIGPMTASTTASTTIAQNNDEHDVTTEKLTKEIVPAAEAYTYKYYKKPKNWYDAKKECENVGATMFYPKNEQEVRQVLPLLPNSVTGDKIWLGIHLENKYYRTIDGQYISNVYNLWNDGQPKANGIFNCVILFNHVNPVLVDHACERYYPFICKTPAPERRTTPTYNWMLPATLENYDVSGNEDIRYLNTSRAIYTFYNRSTTWDIAQSQCAQNGATLFHPEDEPEVLLILRGLTINPIWLGMHKTHDTFTPVDSSRMRDVYRIWKVGQPGIDGVYDCVALFFEESFESGVLVDQSCDQKFPFICKTYLPGHDLQTADISEVVTTESYSTESNLGSNVCSFGPRIVDDLSKSHEYFGQAVADELKKFPTNEKLQTMVAVTKVIQENWSKIQNDCERNT